MRLGGPSGIIEFDAQPIMFDAIKHPDFFGAIIA
jgi:hypothetical protein